MAVEVRVVAALRVRVAPAGAPPEEGAGAGTEGACGALAAGGVGDHSLVVCGSLESRSSSTRFGSVLSLGRPGICIPSAAP